MSSDEAAAVAERAIYYAKSIAAVTPGTNSVAVQFNGQSGSLANGFTYTSSPTVASVSPKTGPPSGGTPVAITGTNFISPATVMFGSSAAINVTVVSSKCRRHLCETDGPDEDRVTAAAAAAGTFSATAPLKSAVAWVMQMVNLQMR
jgi:hypothetical protein